MQEKIEMLKKLLEELATASEIVDRRAGDEEHCNDIEFVQKLIDGHIEVKVDFEKRLKQYLKRYGLSKVNSWTYLAD